MQPLGGELVHREGGKVSRGSAHTASRHCLMLQFARKHEVIARNRWAQVAVERGL